MLYVYTYLGEGEFHGYHWVTLAYFEQWSWEALQAKLPESIRSATRKDFQIDTIGYGELLRFPGYETKPKVED